MTSFVTALAIESWTLWAIGIFLIVCRTISRRMGLSSFKKFSYDDWIMLFITITFTANIVAISQVAQNGSNYLPDGAVELLTPDQRATAIYGSVMTFITEEFTLFTTWLIKACVLIMYGRLTMGLRQHLAVKALAVYCAVGFVVIQVLFLGHWCLPIQQYWALPVTDSQCATYYNHMITATVFNVSSDLMILAIPLPLLITSQLPMKRKLILCCVFSLGIFVILACVLNRYYNFSEPYSPIFLDWYVGESATMVYVANIPLCWPLLRYLFNLNAFGGSPQRVNNLGKFDSPGKDWPRDIYYRRQTQYGANRLPGDIQDLDIELEDEITSGRGNRWISEMGNNHLELTPAELRTEWRSKVRAGRNGPNEEQYENNAIIKTVEVSQYTS